MSLLGLCNTTIDIDRPTWTAGTGGGVVQGAPTVVYNDIPAAVQPARGRLVSEYAREGMHISHVIYTPTPLSLQNGDRVVHSAGTYIVQAWGDMAGRGRGWVIYALRKD